MLHQDRWEEPSKKNLLEFFTYINTTKRAEMCKHEMNKQRNNYNNKNSSFIKFYISKWSTLRATKIKKYAEHAVFILSSFFKNET